MKKIILIFSLMLLTFSGNAQNLYEYIPENTTMLISMRMKQLDVKSKGQDYKTFLRDLVEPYTYSNESRIVSVKSVFMNVDSFGIASDQEIYKFRQVIGDLSGYMFLFKVNDLQKFEKSITSGKWSRYPHDYDYAVSTPYMATEEMIADTVYENTETTVALENTELIEPNYVVERVNDGKLYIAKEQVIGVFSDHVFIFNLSNSYKFYRNLVEDDNDDNDYSYNSWEDYKDSVYFAELRAYRQKTDSLMYVRLNTKKEEDYQSLSREYADVETGILERARKRASVRKMEKQKKQLSALTEFMKNNLSKPVNHIGKNRNFLSVHNANNDFMYFSQFTDMLLAELRSEFSNRRYNNSKTFKTFPIDLISEATTLLTLNFNNGVAEIGSVANINSRFQERLKEALDVKFDKNLFKYIEKENLMGYIAYRSDNLKMAELYKDVYVQTFNHITNGIYADGTTGFELAWNFIDKEKLFNTFGGGAIFAVTGFSDVSVNVVSYDYDEDFNRTEKVETRVEKQPKVVYVTTVNNHKNAKDIIDILSRFSFVQKVNENILVIPSQYNFRTELYIVLTKSVLLITNDKDLALKNSSGLPSSKIMESSEQKFITSHMIACRTFTEKTLNNVRNNYFSNGGYERWYNPMFNALGNFELYTDLTATGTQGRARLILKDSSENSLSKIIELMFMMK